MNILDNDSDDEDGEKAVPRAPARDPVKEAEILTSPAQVILDVRREIEAFKNGGSRKEMVEALRDQFIATRHQAAAKAEAVRMLALEMLQARLPEIKSTTELLRVISALSKVSENDLAVLHGAVPGSGALINFQQLIGGLGGDLGGSGHRLALSAGEAGEDGTSNPIKDAGHTLESFEHMLKHIKASQPKIESAGIKRKENEPDGQDNLIPWRRSRG
jgi:hypothetical protein